MSESINVSSAFFNKFNEFVKNDGKIDQVELDKLKKIAETETNSELKKASLELVNKLENKDEANIKVKLKNSISKTEPVTFKFDIATKKTETLESYFSKLGKDLETQPKIEPIKIDNKPTPYDTNYFTDVKEKEPEVKKLWDNAFKGSQPEKTNRTELRKLANDNKAIQDSEPMERYLVIEKLSQVMDMSKDDEKAISNVILASAKKGDLNKVVEEMLGDEKFYAIYNRLSKETKEVVAPLIGNNLPEFYPKDINQKTFAKIKELREKGELGKTPYDTIIVPGYTPLGAKNPTPLTDKAKERLKTAVEDFRSGKAPFILVSGGSVHPESTRVNEAKVMRDYLIKELKVPEDRILVEGIARHSTTNLRNAGRMMLEHGLKNGVIVSDPGFMGMVSQTDYFNMVFFNLRYLNNHGQWSPGEIKPVEENFMGIGNKRNLFTPSQGVNKKDYVNDPLDP
ncbi:MAG: YdcF family protein [Candidatus Sericytochromatia bacterium]